MKEVDKLGITFLLNVFKRFFPRFFTFLTFLFLTDRILTVALMLQYCVCRRRRRLYGMHCG